MKLQIKLHLLVVAIAQHLIFKFRVSSQKRKKKYYFRVIINSLWVCATLYLVSLCGFFIHPVLSQTTITLTDSLTQSLPSLNVIPVTPTPSLQERMTDLEAAIHDLDAPSKGYWALILEKGDPFVWQILVFILIFINRKAIQTFADRIASVADKASIEVWGVKYTVPVLSNLILQREILKIGIRIATIDGEYHALEGELLKNKAEGMYEQVKSLALDDVEILLQEAIRMAVADKVIKDSEYREILLIASQYEFSHTKVNEMVIQSCLSHEAEPPSSLKDKFDERKTV